jgi:L-2-hydroxyglutarate oxidase
LNEFDWLENLYRRGIENGIELELLDENNLKRIELAAITHGKFLWSPTTAIANTNSIIECLTLKFKKLSGEIISGQEITIRESKGLIRAYKQGNEFPTSYIINAGGVHADRIAKSIGAGTEFACLPFKGVYRMSKELEPSPKTQIYPFTHPSNPFFRVYITLTIDGDVKIRPTAIPLFGGEQYSIASNFQFREFKDSLKSMSSLIKGKKYDLG